MPLPYEYKSVQCNTVTNYDRNYKTYNTINSSTTVSTRSHKIVKVDFMAEHVFYCISVFRYTKVVQLSVEYHTLNEKSD